MKKTLYLVAMLALIVSLFCVVSVANASVMVGPAIVVDGNTVYAYADISDANTKVEITDVNTRLLLNEDGMGFLVYYTGSGNIKVNLDGAMVSGNVVGGNPLSTGSPLLVIIPEGSGSVTARFNTTVTPKTLYIETYKSDIGAISATCEPASFVSGSCPNTFNIKITARKKTDGLEKEKLQSGWYNINGNEIPIVWDTTAIKSDDDGKSITVSSTDTAIGILNTLPGGSKNYIFLQLDPAKGIFLQDSKENANMVSGVLYYPFGTLQTSFNVTSGSVPSTGDSTPIALLAGLMAIAAVAVVLVLRKKHAAA